jgi:xanthine dehydrogenase accessory factor
LSFDIGRGLVPIKDGPLLFRYAPKPALVLAGRGAIFRTTAALAASMEFDLHLASPDEVDLDSLVGLGAVSAQLMTTPDQSPPLPVDRKTAVLLLFHDHEWEQAILLAAAPQSPFFLGALGSMKTQARRLSALEDIGADAALRARVRGPIGLVPSLRSASQIAVSALAEVISAMPVAQEQLRPQVAQTDRHQPAQ